MREMSTNHDFPPVEYIDIKNPPAFKYMTDVHSPKKVAIILVQTDEFKPVKLTLVNDFITEIMSTSEKYISPVVFINLVRNHANTHARVVFDNYDLFKLRVWCNQFREYASECNDVTTIFNSKKMMYLAYVICSKCIEFAKIQQQ